MSPRRPAEGADFKETLRAHWDGGEIDEATGQPVPPVRSYREFVRRLNDVDCVLIESWIERFVDLRFGFAASSAVSWRLDVPPVDDASSSFRVARRASAPDGLSYPFGGVLTADEPASLAMRLQLCGGAPYATIEFDRRGRRLPVPIELSPGPDARASSLCFSDSGISPGIEWAARRRTTTNKILPSLRFKEVP